MARSTFRRSVSGGKSAAGITDFVREHLERDPLWRFLTFDNRWICPYCLAAVRSPQPGKAPMQRAIERHLSQRCPRFANGTGAHEPQHKLEERLRHENIAHLAMTEPAWQVFDHEGYWYSPASLKKVPSVRLKNRRFDTFTIQNMVAHLAHCPHYQNGTIHDVRAVQAARDRGIRVAKLAGNIRRSLSYPHWRQYDGQGHWICPYCLTHVSSISIDQRHPLESFTERMAEHLLCECTAFRPDRQELQTLDRIQHEARDGSAAGGAAGATPARPPSTTVSSHNVPIATPLPDSAAEFSPPVAAPAERSPIAVPVAKPAARTPDPALQEAVEAIGWMQDDHQADKNDHKDALPHANSLDWMDALEHAAASSTTTPSSASVEQGTDLLRARDVQQSMLRESPCLPGFTFATRFQSCSAVSGDFYEFITMPDGCIGFAQGDVSGHGVQAGLIMSMAKKVLSIYARQTRSPRQVLCELNDALVEDLGGRMFITMTYAILDPRHRTITWARAGHSPTLCLNLHTNEMSEIKPSGMVVGMKAGEIFHRVLQEEVTEVRSGDIFLTYTDGVTETMNRQQEEYGEERLQETLRAHAALEVDDLLERILDSIRSFSGGGDPQDDITLLGLRVD